LFTERWRGWIRISAGMGGDGSESVQGRVGMGVKSAGMGGDGTKIPSPCTPLVAGNTVIPHGM